jgi:hypothetical protein
MPFQRIISFVAYQPRALAPVRMPGACELADNGTCWHSTIMSVEAIEQKLVELTARIERLEEKSKPIAKPTWREVFGAIPDDGMSREAAQLGEEWRRSEGSTN